MARRDANGNANGSGGGASGRQRRTRPSRGRPFSMAATPPISSSSRRRYQRDPASLDPSWRDFFAQIERRRRRGCEGGARASLEAARAAPLPSTDELVSALDGNWAEVGRADQRQAQDANRRRRFFSQDDLLRATRDSMHALMMIRAYRMRGHLHANLDPLGLEPPKDREELHPAAYGFSEADYSRKIFIDGVLGLQYATVPEMLKILRRTYCGTIGFEFMHISDPAEKSWLQQRIEGPDKEITFTKEGKRAILTKLVESEGFERFLDIKYTGTKRFGLDGAEAMVPALEQIIKRGGALGVQDIVLGMAHRGRLNVLSQVMGKPHRAIFNEFKGGSFTARRRRRVRRRQIPSWRLVRPRLRQQQGSSFADGEPVASRDRRSRRARQGARQAGSIA